jgi:hypothetical protein
LAIACLLSFATVGCATNAAPPTVQMTVATAALDAANAAGAQSYAPSELSLATTKLSSARKALQQKDYDVALRFAEQAQADAQLAVSKTQSAKSRKAADDALSNATPATTSGVPR